MILETLFGVLLYMNAEVTRYSEIDSCHYENCIMANGERAHIGAAACPRSLPFGTIISIDDEEYVCKDRTAKRYDGRFDLFTGYGKEAHTEALQFGIQKLDVQVIHIDGYDDGYDTISL